MRLRVVYLLLKWVQLVLRGCRGLKDVWDLQVDRYKSLLVKQRDIMTGLTGRLNERDEQILRLQEELEAYDSHQKWVSLCIIACHLLPSQVQRPSVQWGLEAADSQVEILCLCPSCRACSHGSAAVPITVRQCNNIWRCSLLRTFGRCPVSAEPAPIAHTLSLPL